MNVTDGEIRVVAEPKIVDVIAQKMLYSDQVHYFVVVDEPVRYVYTASGDGAQKYFLGRCGDFFDYLAGSARKGEAFGGHQFDIELDDGTKFHCAGDVWACCPRETDPETISVGVSTLAELAECYVFSSGHIRREVLEAWLAANAPSSDYYKHDKKRKRSPMFTPPKRRRSHAYRLRRAERRAARQS